MRQDSGEIFQRRGGIHTGPPLFPSPSEDLPPQEFLSVLHRLIVAYRIGKTNCKRKPWTMIISAEGSMSVDKTPCSCQGALPNWWRYNDLAIWLLMTSPITGKKWFTNHLWGSKTNSFGCHRHCIRQLPAFALTGSECVRRQRDAYGYNQGTSYQHLQAGRRRKGAARGGMEKPLETNWLLCSRGHGAETSSSPPHFQKESDSAQFCRCLHQAVQRLGV